MSYEISMRASRQVQVLKTGAIQEQHIRFSCWQTPDEVTEKIMSSEDKFSVYKEWVMSISKDEEVFVFAYDDPLCERTPIRVETYNAGVSHCRDLDDWLAMCKEEGYDVEVYAW